MPRGGRKTWGEIFDKILKRDEDLVIDLEIESFLGGESADFTPLVGSSEPSVASSVCRHTGKRKGRSRTEDDAVARAMEGQVVKLDVLDTDYGRLYLSDAAHAVDGAVDNWVSTLTRLKSEDALSKQRMMIQSVVEEAKKATQASRAEVAKANRLTSESLQALDVQLKEQGRAEHKEVMKRVMDTHRDEMALVQST